MGITIIIYMGVMATTYAYSCNAEYLMAQSVVIISIRSECTSNATTTHVLLQGTFRKKPLVAIAMREVVKLATQTCSGGQSASSQGKNHVSWEN